MVLRSIGIMLIYSKLPGSTDASIVRRNARGIGVTKLHYKFGSFSGARVELSEATLHAGKKAPT